MKLFTLVLLPLLLCSTTGFAQSDTVSHSAQIATSPDPFVLAAAPEPHGTPPLFDSRALMITNPAGGFGGGDASVLQGTSSSFGATATGNFRLAEDFVVPAEGWTLTGVTVYVYQTQATPSTTSTLTGMTLRIWDGDPSLGTSTILFGDTTANVLTSSAFSGIFRTSSTTPTNGQRAIMGATAANLAVTLPAGTYWVDFSVNGSLASGPFAPFVTIPGQSASGNAKQQTVDAGTWALIVDTGSTFNQTLPLTLAGTVTVSDVIFANNFEL